MPIADFDPSAVQCSERRGVGSCLQGMVWFQSVVDFTNSRRFDLIALGALGGADPGHWGPVQGGGGVTLGLPQLCGPVEVQARGAPSSPLGSLLIGRGAKDSLSTE